MTGTETVKLRPIVSLTLLGFAFLATNACAQVGSSGLKTPPVDTAPAPTDSSQAVRAFVQHFYDVYTDPSFSPAWPWLDVDQFVDAKLMTALRADSVASLDMRRSREIINFDPFLDSQDPCPHYAVVEVRRNGAAYDVTVKPVCADPRWQTQRPVVEVMRQGDRWMITNMRYDHAGPKDLRGLLCEWAKADMKPERRPAKCVTDP
jgi:hypothetical protein